MSIMLKAVLVVTSTVLATWFRRPDQFTHPYIWVEDCAMNIHAFFQHGWLSVFYPYPLYIGYFSFPSKLLFALATSISFRWFPEISFALALLFQCLVLLAVTFSPTRLRCRVLCALWVLLIPTNAEVFGVSLYAGWWGSLLALLPLLWRDEKSVSERAFRIGLLAVGAFSSPLIIALLPLYALRHYQERNRQTLMDLVIAGVITTIQVVSLATIQTMHLSASYPLTLTIIPTLIAKFFGYFVFLPPDPASIAFPAIVGTSLLIVIGIVAVAWRRRLDVSYYYLLACLAFEIAMICARQGSDPVIHPVLAGPRYFFFPYVTLGWIVIQTLALEERALGVGAVSVLALSAWNAYKIPPRRHTAVDWRAQVQACTTIDGYKLPFHFNGAPDHMGNAITTTTECRNLVSHSLFDNSLSAGVVTQ